MYAYATLHKIRFKQLDTNLFNCELIYDFTNYRKQLSFNFEIHNNEELYIIVNALDNTAQIITNYQNLPDVPHLFFFKVKRENSIIRITDSNIMSYENSLFSYLIDLNSTHDNQISNINHRLDNIEQVNNRQDIDIQNIFNRIDDIDQTNNRQDNDIQHLQNEVNIINQNIQQHNNYINRLNIYTEEVNSAYYSSFIVTDNFDTINPEIGLLVYQTTTNELYKYTTSGWIKIDWQKIIQTMPEFQIGRLRINNNVLEISPNGTDWYPCYPLIGASVFNIRTLDDQNYSYKYYLPPGATVIIENANHVPIVYTPAVVPMFVFQGFWTHAYEQWVGLRPSNIVISDGIGQLLAGFENTVNTSKTTNLSIVPFYEQGDVDENWNYATLTIRENQKWLVLSICQGFVNFAVHLQAGTGTAPSSSYWLGTWYRQDGVQFTADYVTITRRR